MTIDISSQQCVPCRKDSPPLSSADIQSLHADYTPDWNVVQVDGIPHLKRAFEFKDFAQAMQFSQKIGEIADQQDHHPRIVTEWGKTTVEWWTHAINGLHQNDFIMAIKVDEIWANWGVLSVKINVVKETSHESSPTSDPSATR